jgi:rhamnosyltransferase
MMIGAPVSVDASVIVRSKNKVETIEATLRSMRNQTSDVEIIVVDSGSTDGTLEIARRWADQIIEIPPEGFTYGGALNAGAASASASVHFALSAHCAPRQRDWVERSLLLYRDDRVVATNGAFVTPRGTPIDDCYLQTRADALAKPGWGFSNHASSWRASAWASMPFRTDLPACEDKEWSWRVIEAGWLIAYSPSLAVPSGHRRRQGPRQLHRRVSREAAAMVSLGAARPLTTPEAVRLWWTYFNTLSPHPKALRRANPFRILELAGAVAGGGGADYTIRAADLFEGQDGWRAFRPPYNPLV